MSYAEREVVLRNGKGQGRPKSVPSDAIRPHPSRLFSGFHDRGVLRSTCRSREVETWAADAHRQRQSKPHHIAGASLPDWERAVRQCDDQHRRRLHVLARKVAQPPGAPKPFFHTAFYAQLCHKAHHVTASFACPRNLWKRPSAGRFALAHDVSPALQKGRPIRRQAQPSWQISGEVAKVVARAATCHALPVSPS
jgi:hypothetical protein